MNVVIGNPFALEGFRDEHSDDPELVRYRLAPGERETTFIFPEGMSINEALLAVVETTPRHIDLSVGPPAWIECDEPLLKKMLCQHFGVSERKRRPARWGDGSNGPYITHDNNTKETA